MSGSSRRDFGKFALGGLAAGMTAFAFPNVVRGAGAKVVVIGGGWAGLTAATEIKRLEPGLDVTVVERRSSFLSCPLSNLWLADLVEREFLEHDYQAAAGHGGWKLAQATVLHVDRQRRRVETDKGALDYDFLVVAPGIDLDYADWGVDDPEALGMIKEKFPAAASAETGLIGLKKKVRTFEGGTFVLTVPSGNYRCLAMPYERACMIARVFQRDGVNGKVVLLDERDEPAVQPQGFLAAFEELHGDHLEYLSGSRIEGIDPASRTITTEFDEIEFDDGAIYPRVRGSKLLETLGLVNPKSRQKEAHVDPFTYRAVGDERVFVIGDSRPQPFSKSGNTARTEAKYVASVLVAQARDQALPAWESPTTSCFSVVGADPMEAIMVETTYHFDRASGEWAHGHSVNLDERSEDMGRGALGWARNHYDEMFG